MEPKPKVRLGSGKKRSESWMTSSICISDAEAHAYTYNGKKYVNISINIFDEQYHFGNDVSITLNDYEKDSVLPKANSFETAPFDDLPF